MLGKVSELKSRVVRLESKDKMIDIRPNKYQVALWAMLLVLAAFLSLRNYQSFQIGVYQDDSEYAVLAQSLVQSDAYGLMNTPEQSVDTRYPFGYPLLLAPFTLLFPESLNTLKVPSLIATVLNMSLLFWGWRWFSRCSSYWWGLAVVGLYSMSPLTIGQTRMVMSEPIFMMFCLASILLTERARNKSQGFVWCILMSLCLLFTVFTRMVGSVLVTVIVVYLLFARGRGVWGELLVVVAGAIILLGIIIAVTPVTLKDILPIEYTNQFLSPSSLGQDDQEDRIGFRFFVATQEYLEQHIARTVSPIGGGDRERAFADRLGLPFLPALFGLTVSGVIALGYLRWVSTKGISIAFLFSVLYLGVMILWPWRGPRFLYPIQPQLYFGLLLGIAAVLSWIIPVLGKGIPLHGGIMMMVVLGLISLNIYRNLSLDDSRSHTGDLQIRSSWLRDNTESLAIVMTEQPQTDYLYSRRKTVPYREFESLDEFESYLHERNVAYIIVAPQLQWQSTYSPTYSPRTLEVVSMIEILALEGRTELVYSFEPQFVKIFKVLAEEE